MINNKKAYFNKVITVLKKVLPPFITIFAFLLIYFPIMVITLLSFNDSKKDYTFRGFSLRWYREILLDDDLFLAIFNTLTIAILSTIIATIVGTITAIGINSLTKNNRIKMMILNNVPVINPDIVTGISIMLVLGLFPISFGMKTMLLAHVFFSIPFVVLTVLPKLKELDPNLFDAALDLGCTRFKAIRKVIIPSIKTGIIGGALIAFTMSIDDFVISYFTTGPAFQNVSIYIYTSLGRKSFSPAVYSYNTLVVFVTIFTLLIINKFNKKQKV
jgi:spermidine/putrescine transport system permease protein